MDELARFHILYQAIEVMITVIFQHDFKKFVESLSDSDSINYLSEKEEVLKEMMGEKGRVKKLINQYTNVSSKKKTNLDNACTELLNSVQFPYKNGNQLYGCRCLLVHNMYRINPEDRNRIKEINDFFMDVLIEMVQTFEIH